MRAVLTVAALTAALLTGSAQANDVLELQLVAKNGVFQPDTLQASAGQKVVLVIRNEGKDAIEFESRALRKEKVVAPGREARLELPALKAGEYVFFDEYHEKTGQGRLIVK